MELIWLLTNGLSLFTEPKLKVARDQRGKMQIEVEVQEGEAGAEVAESSSSPTLFLNRGLRKWCWKREVGNLLDSVCALADALTVKSIEFLY